MRKKFYFILMAICMLPMTTFASEYVAGTSANDYFDTLTGSVYNKSSDLGVSDGPYVETIFEVDDNTKITGIWTYHWNASNHNGATIKLVNVDTNDVYGPWDVVTDKGYLNTPDVNWYVFPNVVIPAGRYKLVDSHNDTWSWASNTDGKGIATIKGFKPLGNVTINGSDIAPVVGETPKKLNVPAGANYTIKGLGWTSTPNPFEKDKPYNFDVTILPNEGYAFQEGDTVTIEGIDWDDVIQYVREDIPGSIHFRGHLELYSERYNYILGANLESEDKTKFKFKIDADYNKFREVYIDGNFISYVNYEVSEGSTIIEFKPEFIESLAIGEHNLLVVFKNGSVKGAAKTKFTKLSSSVPEDENLSDTEVIAPENIINPIEEVTSKTKNPQTGDNIIISIILGILSVIGIVGISIYKKKKFN